MAWVFVPPVADLGPRIPVTWTAGAYAAAGDTKVTIHGSSSATFTSDGAGAETITIVKNADPPVIVSSLGSETTIANWIETINDEVAGVVDEDVFTGRLRLGASDKIAVTDYGGTGGPAAAFEVIGLPVMPRDGALGPQTFVQVEPSISSQHISDVITVPDGANYCTIHVMPIPAPIMVWDIRFLVAFSNGTEGLPSGGDDDGVASVFDLVPEPLVLPFSVSRQDRVVQPDVLRLRNIAEGLVHRSAPLEYLIPPGYDRLYICPLQATGLDGGPIPGRYVPLLSATVNFGAR